jgi:hypothetical protein
VLPIRLPVGSFSHALLRTSYLHFLRFDRGRSRYEAVRVTGQPFWLWVGATSFEMPNVVPVEMSKENTLDGSVLSTNELMAMR